MPFQNVLECLIVFSNVTICTHGHLCVFFSVYACVNLLVFVADSVLIGTAHYSIPTPPGGTNSRLSHTLLYATVTHFITTLYHSGKLFDFQEEGQSEIKMVWVAHTNIAKANGKHTGGAWWLKKGNASIFIRAHMTGHMLRPPCSLCFPCLHSLFFYRMQTYKVSIEEFLM